MTNKELVKKVILKIPAGQASAKAPLGPTLGQYGIPIGEFCTQFNDQSKNYKEGITIKCILSLFDDDSYEISLTQPDFITFVKNSLEIDILFPTKSKDGILAQRYFISTGMLVELLAYYWGGQWDKNKRSYFKKTIAQLRKLGIIVID